MLFDFDKDGFACIGGNIGDSNSLKAVIDKVVGLAVRADIELSQGYAHNHILATISGTSTTDEILSRVFNIEELLALKQRLALYLEELCRGFKVTLEDYSV